MRARIASILSAPPCDGEPCGLAVFHDAARRPRSAEGPGEAAGDRGSARASHRVSTPAGPTARARGPTRVRLDLFLVLKLGACREAAW